MDLLSKIDELRAKEVTPEEFKDVWGEDEDKVAKRVMNAVKKARKEKTDKKAKTITVEPYAPAAGVLDPAAAAPSGSTTKKLVDLASELSRRYAAKPFENKKKTGFVVKPTKTIEGIKGIGIEVVKLVDSPKKGKLAGSKLVKGTKGPKGGGPK